MSELRLRRYHGYKKTRASTKKMLRMIWEFGSSNNDRFLVVNMIFFYKETAKLLELFYFDQSCVWPSYSIVFCLLLHKFYFFDFLLHVTAPFYLYINTKCVRGVFFWDHTVLMWTTRWYGHRRSNYLPLISLGHKRDCSGTCTNGEYM